MSITIDQLQSVAGHGSVVTEHGDKVGSIGQVYVDDSTGEPSWVTVKTGLFGSAETFVPVENARLDGHDIVVGYLKDTIKAAPRVDADGSLSPEEEQTLYRHYGLSGADVSGDADVSAGSGRDRSGRDRSGGSDDAMTRSEERLQVGTQTREAGRARMRKYIVTERVTQTVPVSHEEVRVVREPVTDANRGPAMSGPAISEEEHEVVLHAETPVVEKTVVPVERVRLDTTTVTDQETVSADVRKEHIELDDPTANAKTSAKTNAETRADAGFTAKTNVRAKKSRH